MMMPISGYATLHGYTHLPLESQRLTSSVSRTVTHTPIDSQPSSASTSQLEISSRRLRYNTSEPDTPITDQSTTHAHMPRQVGVRDIHNRLVIELDGYTFDPDDAKKCAWRPKYESQICANFHKKAEHLLANLLMKAHKYNKKPRWILLEEWKKFIEHWAMDARFKQMSEIDKKARSSTKDGSLYTSGAQSQENVRKKMEKELGRPVTQAEAFKVTHTKKKENPKVPDIWAEPRTELTYSLPEDIQGMPLSQEQAERIWLDSIGGPSRYGYAYDMPQQTFHEYHSELEGLGSSYDDGSRNTNLALEQKIAELSSQVEAAHAREK